MQTKQETFIFGNLSFYIKLRKQDVHPFSALSRMDQSERTVQLASQKDICFLRNTRQHNKSNDYYRNHVAYKAVLFKQVRKALNRDVKSWLNFDDELLLGLTKVPRCFQFNIPGFVHKVLLRANSNNEWKKLIVAIIENGVLYGSVVDSVETCISLYDSYPVFNIKMPVVLTNKNYTRICFLHVSKYTHIDRHNFDIPTCDYSLELTWLEPIEARG